MTETRIENLREKIENNQAVLITSDVNRLYFSGFKSSAGAVVITKKNAYLLVDFRYFENAKKSVKNLKVIMYTSYYNTLKEIFESENIKEIYCETDFITVEGLKTLKKQLPDYRVLEENEICRYIKNMRSVKSEFELESIKKAQAITDKTFSHILDFISTERTEKEIALEMEFFMRKNGSEGIAFDTIVVSGKNSSLPHGVPTDKKIDKGDFITMDFGAVVNGYCSDMTRTVAVGFVSVKQREVYETVLKAQTEALKAIKPSAECKEIDKIARDIIDNAGFENCFGHGLGHSVGLEIHESPCFNTRDNTKLQNGMILTVEPGIYIENEFGVRIEDMVNITEDGYENLTASTKELIII